MVGVRVGQAKVGCREEGARVRGVSLFLPDRERMEFEPEGRRSGQTKSDFDLLSFPRRGPPPRVHAYQTPEGSLVHRSGL